MTGKEQQPLRITMFEAVANPSHSMDRYRDELSAALRVQHRQDQPLQITTYHPPQPRLLDRMRPIISKAPFIRHYAEDRFLATYVTYPLLARWKQGHVNHILHHHEAHLLRTLDPARTVVTCHDLMPMYFDKIDPTPSRAYRLFLYSVRWLHKAARVIAVSQATKRSLLEYLHLPEDKVSVIPNGVGPPFRRIEEPGLLADVAARYGLPDGPRVLHVGVSHGQKNIEGLLHAFRLLIDTVPDVTLIKVGADLMPQQKRLARQLGIEGRIHVLPDVPLNDLPLLYASSDVLAFPSLYEGFGLPVLEAMACGTPVVASDIETIREVAGDAAILVDPRVPPRLAHALSIVLEQKDLRERLRDFGFARVQGFSWDASARSMMKVYEEFAHTGGSSVPPVSRLQY